MTITRRYWEEREGVFFETMGAVDSTGRKVGRIQHGALVLTADYAKRASEISAFTARSICTEIAQQHADKTGREVIVTLARGGKVFAVAKPVKP